MKVIANGQAVRRSGAALVLQNGDVRHFTRVRVVAIVLGRANAEMTPSSVLTVAARCGVWWLNL